MTYIHSLEKRIVGKVKRASSLVVLGVQTEWPGDQRGLSTLGKKEEAGHGTGGAVMGWVVGRSLGTFRVIGRTWGLTQSNILCK